MPESDGLDDVEMRFVEQYLIDRSAGSAGRRVFAALSRSNAWRRGVTIFARPHVRYAIRQRILELRKKFNVTFAEQVRILRRVQFDPKTSNKDVIAASTELNRMFGYHADENLRIVGADGKSAPTITFVDESKHEQPFDSWDQVKVPTRRPPLES